ncbi:hypothetical protein PybrP1_012372 [[Pythium] brassicae (nom. inval.)]|nr:hypothetical protein PybrP1_012372 [[Pythium] brassicae (nom. inval.)]
MGACVSRVSASASFAALYALDDKQILAERPFATVYSGRHLATGVPVAIKRICKQRRDSGVSTPPGAVDTTWAMEVAAIRRCEPPPRHPNIVAFERVFESRYEVLVVMEIVSGGQLFDALISDGAYSEWDARRFVRDVLEALKFLHARGVVHRDVTPENLLFTSRDSKTATIKVVNFATAKLLSDRTTTAAATAEQLTWPYCAPELLATIDAFASRIESIRGTRAGSMAGLSPPAADGLEASEIIAGVNALGRNSAVQQHPPPQQQADDEAKCDVWSVGIVLYVLLSGAHPFDLDGRQTRDQIVQNILCGSFSMSSVSWDAVSGEAKELLSALLQVDLMKRPSASEALEHAWFASPHTPREPLSVSMSDGLGQYQRLMRKKFRMLL